MKAILLALLITVQLISAPPAEACFGPKLYVATETGDDAELRYQLISIYLQETTGIESIRVELTVDQTAEELLQQEKIDLGFATAVDSHWPSLLQVGEMFLLSGPRPTTELQFSTVPEALNRLQTRLDDAVWLQLRQQVAAGRLPAKAVRQLYRQRGWI